MAIPSVIRKSITDYLMSVVFVQRYGIQDPLVPNVQMGSGFYPPNNFMDLPIEVFEIRSDDKNSDGSFPTAMVCHMRIPIRMSYVFHRELFPTFRSVPIRQIENLFIKLALIISQYYNIINPDITKIVIPLQSNMFSMYPAQDVNSDNVSDPSWAVGIRLFIDVDFMISPLEFIPEDYNQIQPAIFSNPDSTVPPNILDQGQELKGINLYVERGELVNWNPKDPTTYEQVTELDLRKSDTTPPIP